jgi:Tc5 transposase DNA-binding domain
LALKEFILSYQHRVILSDSILIEKAKLLATGLGVPENTLLFSSGWLYGFKKRNNIHQIKLQGEAASANEASIEEALPLLQSKCANYTSERIYNMDETGLFYQ